MSALIFWHPFSFDIKHVSFIRLNWFLYTWCCIGQLSAWCSQSTCSYVWVVTVFPTFGLVLLQHSPSIHFHSWVDGGTVSGSSVLPNNITKTLPVPRVQRTYHKAPLLKYVSYLDNLLSHNASNNSTNRTHFCRTVAVKLKQ